MRERLRNGPHTNQFLRLAYSLDRNTGTSHWKTSNQAHLFKAARLSCSQHLAGTLRTVQFFRRSLRIEQVGTIVERTAYEKFACDARIAEVDRFWTLRLTGES